MGLIGGLPAGAKGPVAKPFPTACARGSETANGGAVMGCNLHSLDSEPLNDGGGWLVDGEPAISSSAA